MNIAIKRISLSLMVLACAAAVLMVAAITTGKAISGTSLESLEPLVRNAEPLNECYQETESQPRTALAGCIDAKFQAADKEMRVTYGKVESDLKSIDSAGTQAALASLAASQQAFVAFRLAECQRIGDAAMGGSGAGDFQRACEVRLTRWRIDELKNQQ